MAHNDSMKQPEYIEGPEATENFKRLAARILQTPANKKKQPNEAASQESEPKSDKD
jgi:hypothetical protein